MNNWLSFHSMVPIWWVASLSFLLLLVFAFFEWRRKYRFPFARFICGVILMVSIAAMVVRPSVTSSHLPKQILLLTDNFTAAKADSILQVVDMDVFQLGSTSRYRKANRITLNELTGFKNRIAIVLGDGIPVSFLRSNRNVSFEFRPAMQKPVLSSLEIPEIYAGQTGLLRGRFSGLTDSVFVVLASPGGREDSVWVTPANGLFSLKMKPQQTGLFTYQFKSTGEVAVDENVPVEVLSPRQLNILFLQNYPTFETRQLKDYLRSVGYKVIVRHQVSKGVYRFEFVNTEASGIQRITPSLLSTIDLVVGGQSAFEQLTNSEGEELEKAVVKGLGMLVLMEDPEHVKGLVKGKLPAIAAVNSDTAKVNHFTWSQPLLVHSLPFRGRSGSDIKSIWRDLDNQILTGYQFSGLGKIGFQLMDKTYPLALEGKTDLYAQLWSSVLEETARRWRKPFRIGMMDEPPYFLHQPLRVEVIAAADTPELTIDQERLPLREDELVDDVWTSMLWVNTPGWHHLVTQDSSQLNFYVHQNGEWSLLATENQIRENKIHHSEEEKSVAPLTRTEEISPLIFLILFLLSAGFLWLSPKL